MCVLNVRGDYVGLTLYVWHTNCYPIILPVSSVAGKGGRMHLVRVSGKGGMAANGRRIGEKISNWDREWRKE